MIKRQPARNYQQGCQILSYFPSVVVVRNVMIMPRADPEFFSPERLEIVSYLKNSGLGVPLETLVSVVSCRTAKRDIARPYLSVNHIVNRCLPVWNAARSYTPVTKGQLVKNATLLFSGINPGITRVCFVPESQTPIECSSEFICMKVREDISPWYMIASLLSDFSRRQLKHLGRSSSGSRQRLLFEDLKQVYVPLIPKHQRERISKLMLRAYDLWLAAESIEEEYYSLLEEVFRTKYQSTSASFKVFVPFHEIDLQRLDVDFYNPKYLSKMVIEPKSLVHLRQLAPHGILSGKTPHRRYQSGRIKVNVISVASLTGHGLNLSEVRKMYAPYSFVSRFELKRGNILLVKDAHYKKYVGKKVDIYLGHPSPAIASSELMVLRVNPTKVSPFYLLAFLRSKTGYSKLQRGVTGITSHLYPNYVASIKVPLHTPPILKKISNLVETLETHRLESQLALQQAIDQIDLTLASLKLR